DRPERSLAAEIELAIDDRSGGAEDVGETILREDPGARAVLDDGRDALAAGDVDATLCGDGRAIDLEVLWQPNGWVGLAARPRVDARQDALIVTEEVERSVVEEKRRNIGRSTLARPRHVLRAGDVALRSIEPDREQIADLVAACGEDHSRARDR